MDNIADITMRGEQIKDDFGGTVSSAGDVNGDGFSDVMVGAITFNNIYNSQDGRVYIYFGGTSMDTSKDVTFYGETGSQFGRFSSKAGDMNGDGYSDVIIGAEKPDSSTGRAYIYYGGAQMNNSVDIVLNGEAINSEFGTSVSSGDFNKDGYSDVIVGAHKYSTNTGRAYVYLASAIGLPDNKEY
ncbi:MAG: FG-GAP repeat protein, partial [Ignavibacteria bacterium]|nr:FG-GAP repeat protein [Ignavibacteria bacterium]